MRLNMAQALLGSPKLIIMDEPMSGLDPVGRMQIQSLIEDLKKKGKTILFCSHILDDVDRLVDKVLVLDKGEKRFDGDGDELSRLTGCGSISESFLHLVKADQA